MPPKPPHQRPVRRPAPSAVSVIPQWLVGPRWADLRLRQPGWLLVPLRGFLAVTFCYAGLQKLANPTYLDPNNRASVVGQMQLLRHTSPISPLLQMSLHAPTLVGLLIAFGELAVGLGVLLGLWIRLAAVGGMLLSLTFFLTVSWNATPYYYGSDIVFLFAWSAIAAFGACDVLSVDALLRDRARHLTGLRPTQAVVGIEVPRLRELCGRGDSCALRPNGVCTRQSGCPVFPRSEQLRPALQGQLERRTLVLGIRSVGLVAMIAATTGGLTAVIGRLVGGTGRRQGLGGNTPATTNPAATNASPSAAPTAAAASQSGPGTAIGPTSAVPVGRAGRFTDPASGSSAWLVHPAANQFVAFSAICTHAGCTVDFDPGSMQFVCPCHGGTFDAKTGQVLGGPPPSPLPSIPVHVVNGQIHVD